MKITLFTSLSNTNLYNFCFLGIILLSGYHSLTEERDYWSTQPDLGVEVVRETMSKNRFPEHQAVPALRWQCCTRARQQSGKGTASVHIPERAAGWVGEYSTSYSVLTRAWCHIFGKHSAKMYIKGKPIRFGFKIWCLCGNDGFSLPPPNIHWQRRGTSQPSSRVVNTMVDVLEENSDVTRHKLFFDNFFTSYSLLDGLAERGMRSIGYCSRKSKPQVLIKCSQQVKVLKKTASRHLRTIVPTAGCISASGMIIP